MTSCPHCRAEVAAGDRFCADCGARIAPPALEANPGARAQAAGAGLAAATDPGLKHAANQDAFALAGPPAGGDGAIMVVCDGVSRSQTPELAAATAARVALEALVAARDSGAAASASMRDAIVRAHDAVCLLPFDRQSETDPPATTIVAAWLRADGAAVGWLGDSRAYWLGPDGCAALTRDHSWLALTLERGEMPEQIARRDRRAHALVSCLGTTSFAAATPCPEPSVVQVAARPGWLLLCSDGLWNYADAAAEIALAAGAAATGDAAGLCARLVAFARACGGADNVTAAAARFG